MQTTTTTIAAAAATTSAPAATVASWHYLFFDFECTGKSPLAVAFAVVGLPYDPALYDTNITISDQVMFARSVNPRNFTDSTRAWWFSDDMKSARDHIAQHALVFDGDDSDDYMHSAVAAYMKMVRSKYPLLRFATDNPTLDARYLDNILDSFGCTRISLTGPHDGVPWRRVLAVDDLREGFLLASPRLKCIPQRPNCPLRHQARARPNHAPDGDLLRIAADYADLLAAAAAAFGASTNAPSFPETCDATTELLH